LISFHAGVITGGASSVKDNFRENVMKRIVGWAVVVALMTGLMIAHVAKAEEGYCIVVSQATRDDPQWKPVVDALMTKHQGVVITFDKAVTDSLSKLRKELPRYICFVVKPSEATREFVADANRLTRRINDDPYTDAVWGILTGYDAACALRIASHKEPLVIRRVAAGTEVELKMCDEGLWYSELKAGKMVRKEAGKPPAETPCPADSTKAIVDALNLYQPQLFVTSGHATERNWQIGFGYRNGQFRSHAGELVGLNTKGERFSVHSDNPKVYLPVGNCLMGHIDGPDAMALAYMNCAGVYQMVGYTVTTWYGYGGWGLLDYFFEQPGRFTLAEAFFANQQALIHRLETYFPGMIAAASSQQNDDRKLPPQARKAGLTWNDAQGLLYDLDSVAFYGDPGWVARMAPGPLSWEQTLTENGGIYRFEIRPLLGQRSFEPVNTNGSQRGGRPFIQLLPHRIQPGRVQILEGADLKPLVTSNFILVPNPGRCDPQRSYRIVFRVM
jgi:zinc protease